MDTTNTCRNCGAAHESSDCPDGGIDALLLTNHIEHGGDRPGETPSVAASPAAQRYCCEPGCSAAARWMITYSDRQPYDTLDSCDAHLGAMLSATATNTVTLAGAE